MSDKHFVGLSLTDVKDTGKYQPISRVTLMVDDDKALTAGDDTGLELTANCPHATQTMVNNVLAAVRGYQYQAYTADASRLDPAAELGDGVTVGGVYSVITRVSDDGLGYPDLTAPGETELEDEYPSAGPMTQEFNRKLAETRSTITKTSEEIRLWVGNELYGESDLTVRLDSIEGRVSDNEGNISTLTQTASSLTSQISNAEGAISKFEQYWGSITLSVSNKGTSSTITLSANETDEEGNVLSKVSVTSSEINFSGLVSFTDLSTKGSTEINGDNITTGTISASYIDTENLKVKAANIEGTLTIGKQIPSNVATTGDIPTDVSELSNGSGYQTADGVTTIIDGTVTTDYVNALGVSAEKLQGQFVYINDSGGNRVAYMELENTTTPGLTIQSEKYSIRLIAYNNLYLEGGNTKAHMEFSSTGVVGYISVAMGGTTTNPGAFYPSSGVAPNLGHPTYGMWQEVYSYTSAINTSDRNMKHDIEDLPDKYLDLLLNLTPRRYKMNNGASNRYHVGYIAQEVEEVMGGCGIDSLEFAGFVKDVDADGNDIYMLRYEEFIALHTLAIQRLYQRMEAMA